MAQHVGLSQTMVSRIWRALLQPHRQETFKLSRDPAFVDKVRAVVGLCLDPPDRALVLCLDDKPQIQTVKARRRFCRFVQDRLSVAAMITGAMAQQIGLRP